MFSIIVILAVLSSYAGVQAELLTGWNPEDRFFGFRYELRSPLAQSAWTDAQVQAVAQAVHTKADALIGFGWVQALPAGSPPKVVGEFRASKAIGWSMAQYLNGTMQVAGVPDVHAELRVSPDTRIALHFADFRQLSSARITCFHAPPHACTAEEREKLDHEL